MAHFTSLPPAFILANAALSGSAFTVAPVGMSSFATEIA